MMKAVDELVSGITSSLAISESEAVEVVGLEDLENLKAERFLLVGRLLATKAFHKEALIGTLKRIWHTREEFTAVTLDDPKSFWCQAHTRDGSRGSGPSREMTILCWNVRVRQMKCVQRQLGMMGCFSVGREGRAGGLALLWQHRVDVSILSYSPGHIDAILKGVDMETFRFTGFYGNPEMRLRRHSWDLLRHIAGSVQGPWIVGGDFNEILEAHEYFGRRFRPMSQMRAFQEALEECGLATIRFQGYKFTWSNRWQGDGNVKLRLDIMVANGDFVRLFPEVATHHLNSLVSDHLPLLLYLRPSTWSRKHKRFLFEELWTTIEGCQDVISHAWESETGIVVEKLKACQGSLRRWNKDHVGRIPTKLRSLQTKLDDTQRRSFSPVDEFQ
ncbi:unnamed protein product [Prunus brigantina]